MKDYSESFAARKTLKKMIHSRKKGLKCNCAVTGPSQKYEKFSPESKKGKEPRNQVTRKVSVSEEGLEGFPA